MTTDFTLRIVRNLLRDSKRDEDLLDALAYVPSFDRLRIIDDLGKAAGCALHDWLKEHTKVEVLELINRTITATESRNE